MLSMNKQINEQKGENSSREETCSGTPSINQSLEDDYLNLDVSAWRLTKTIWLKDCVKSSRLLEIFSKMDSFLPPILNDLFRELSIGPLEIQDRYRQKANQRSNFFIELIIQEFVQKKSSRFDTLNEVMDKLINLNSMPIIFADLQTYENEIWDQINDSESESSLSTSSKNIERIEVLMFHNFKNNSYLKRIDNFTKKLAKKYDIIIRDISKIKEKASLESELKKCQQSVFLLFDKELERKILDQPFYHLVYEEYLRKSENIRYITFLMDDLCNYENDQGKFQFKYRWLLQKKDLNILDYNNIGVKKTIYIQPFKIPMEKEDELDSKADFFFKNFSQFNDKIISKLEKG